MKNNDVLKLKLVNYYEDEITIGQYLKDLLMTLWLGGESFNSKRPFGNSGWETDLVDTLVVNSVIGVVLTLSLMKF